MDERIALAGSLMAKFAERTGIVARFQRRYLWTDAFAVCNYLGLYRITRDPVYSDLAVQLVDSVHHVLGRERPDSSRQGWLSGLSDDEGRNRPTLAGLRIGKQLPERSSAQPYNADLEWDRDGQYFHYLTKWMHALNQMARAFNDSRYLIWAMELAHTAHRRFTYSVGNNKRMYWKMSIDLTRPLVSSMGQHDPIDGLVTCLELNASAATFDANADAPDLSQAIGDFASMIEPSALVTSDALGIGGLLVDAQRLEHLIHDRACEIEGEFVGELLGAAHQGLRHFTEFAQAGAPANRRLAFRELGLAIGLAATELISPSDVAPTTRVYRERINRFSRLRGDIETFWMREENRSVESWTSHLDINDVMLATSLAPEGFLG